MARAWKTVRVFISSTFRDMHAERDHLVKVVFSALRESLLKDRIYLDDIDLRWGVTREQAENDRVLDLCLKEIDGCRPFFIGILGERYGWVPLKLPADACTSFGWIQDHHGKSVTELEILHGVLNDPAMTERAFFYLRNPDFIFDVPAERKQVFLEGPTEEELRELSPEAAEARAANRRRQLRELKDQLRALRPGLFVFDGYPCHWDAAKLDPVTRQPGRLVGLEAFGESVREKLESAIRTDPKLQDHFAALAAAPRDPFGLAEEQDYHDRFMESRLRVYVGREKVNDDLFAFADGNDPIPCLVTGPSGSGKSAALAHFVSVYSNKFKREIEDGRLLVIPHFIGASPRSTNLRDMLRRFCQVFKARFGFAEDVPEEAAKLSVTFREFVAKVPADSRVLLVIDALNQSDEADRAQELYWLPRELPPQVKVIVSCITDSGKLEPVLEAFRVRKHCPVQVTALTDAEQRLIIRQVPSLSAKTLDNDQVHLLLSNPATANPLFLLVALEELRGFAPYERLNERIGAFPHEGDTVTGIFTQVIERLTEEFNQELVETVLTLLASARRGLSERELQELVDGLDGADDLFPVLRQLRPYLLSRAGLIDFYHRNLFKAVRERYLPSEEKRRQAHGRLAEYFHAQNYWLESLEQQRSRSKALPPTPRPVNVRKVDELPWQLLHAADWQKSEQLFTELAFLEAKAEAGMIFDLTADFSAAVEGMPPDRPLLRLLRLLKEAVRRDLHFIARHPTALFQCMWNTCWWTDTVAVPAAEARQPDGASVQTNEAMVRSKLQSWLTSKNQCTPNFLWLKTSGPLPQPQGQVVFPLPDNSGPHMHASSPDGRLLGAITAEGELQVVETETGRVISSSSPPWRKPIAIAIGNAPDQIAWMDTDGTICTIGSTAAFRGRLEDKCICYDSHSGIVAATSANELVAWRPDINEMSTLSKQEVAKPLSILRLSGNGRSLLIVAGGKNADVQVLRKAQSGWVSTHIDFLDSPIVDADIDFHGSVVLIASQDRQLRVIEVSTGQTKGLAYERANDSVVRGRPQRCSFGGGTSAHLAFIATAQGHLLCWNWVSGETRQLPDFHSPAHREPIGVMHANMSVGHLVISLARTCQVLDPTVRKVPNRFHSAPVSDCAIVSNDLIVSCSELDQSICFIRPDGLQLIRRDFQPHPSAVVYHAGKNVVLVPGRNGAINCWASDRVWHWYPRVAEGQMESIIVTDRNECLVGFSSGQVNLYDLAGQEKVLANSNQFRRLIKFLPAWRSGYCYYVYDDCESPLGNRVTVISLLDRSLQQVRLYDTTEFVTDFAISNDGELIGQAGRRVVIRSVRKHKTQVLYERECEVRNIRFHEAGHLAVVVPAGDDEIAIWSLQQDLPLAVCIRLPASGLCLAVSADQIVAGLASGELLSARISYGSC